MAVVKIGDLDTDQTLSNYSVSEDSTPVDPSDTSGGVSQITLGLAKMDGWKSYRKKTMVLTDGGQGVTSGIITDVAETAGTLSVTANSRLVKASVVRTAQPYRGTLSGAITYYLSLVGITSGVVIDDSLSTISVIFAGWQGDVYLYLTKMLGPAYGFEVSLVGQNVVARPFRGRQAVSYRDGALTETISSGQAAQTVQINYYPSTYNTNSLAYPSGGWNADVQVYQVDAGQIVTIDDIPIDASLTSINQPVCVLNVDKTYSATSVYAIAGNDGLPITPAQWAGTGGSLVMSINEDTKSLKMVLTGSNLAKYAPYRVAMSSGSSNYYSSLRVVGTGVFSKQQSVTLSTALTTDEATQVLGATVDSPFITTPSQAYDKGVWTLAHYSGLAQGLNVQSSGINRLDDNGSYAYATVGDFDALFAGQTIAQFDAAWSGKTIADLNAYWDSTVSDNFANQAFGNLGGARVLRANTYYRIRTASNSQGQISYGAEADTTVGDFDAVWANKSISNFNDFWEGQTVGDFDVAALFAPVYVYVDPTTRTFPSSATFPSATTYPNS